MKFQTIWKGKFPKYWDVTTWALIINNHLVSCYRDQQSNRRIFEVLNIDNSSRISFETLHSVIIGHMDQIVYLARIADARSHIQISRLGAFDINTSKFIWESNEVFLVEKFRIPDINLYSKDQYVLGNKKINLSTGEINDFRTSINYSWLIDNNTSLFQNGNSLDCVDNQHEKKWTLEGYYGNNYQGTHGESLVFLINDKTIVLINKLTGEKQDVIELQGIRTLNNRVFGHLDVRNDSSFQNNTIADVLMNDSVFIWVNESGNIDIKERFSGEKRSIDCNEKKLYLSAIDHQNVLIYALHEEDSGELIVAELEG